VTARAMVVDALGGLIATPSVNPAIAPAEGTGESAVAEYARAWLTSHHVRAWIEHAAPGRPNVVAEAGADNGPTLVLCAHLDTVGTDGMTIPPFEPRLDGDRMYGRGACDMKGSVAAIMAAMVQLSASAAADGAKDIHVGRVMAALVADEEYASVGAFDFVRRHPADACIVTEPAEGALVLAHKGFVWADIVTTGRAAHGSRWDLGVSAIGKMGRIIAALEEFDRTQLRSRVHPLVGPASLHCALVHGGSGLSTYASECRLQVERRTIPGETADEVREELAAVVRATREDARVDIAFARDPCVCDRDARIAACLREAIADVAGRTPMETGVGYWMDAAVFAAAGIPTVNYGPSGAGAHEPVEWVDVNSVVALAEVLVAVARRFCR
jgi:acetylornithine deacetylase